VNNFIINKLKTKMKFIALSAISSLMSLTSGAFVAATADRKYEHEIEASGLISGKVLEGAKCIDGSNCLKGLACGKGTLTGETTANLICMNVVGCSAKKDVEIKKNSGAAVYGKKSEDGCASWPVGAAALLAACNTKADCLTNSAIPTSCGKVSTIIITLPNFCVVKATCDKTVGLGTIICTSAIKASATLAAAFVAVAVTTM
jgi:hypothetical protein